MRKGSKWVEGEVVDPRYVPAELRDELNRKVATRKPRKELIDTEAKRRALAEQVRPLYTQVVGPIPPGTSEGWRQSWSKEREEHLLAFVSSGGIPKVWLDAAGLTYLDLENWKVKIPGFSARFEKARSVGMDALAEEALIIASTPYHTEDVAETTLATGERVLVKRTGDGVYARKLAVQTRLELLKRWAPDRYGDKVTVDVTDKRASLILEARKRISAAVEAEDAEDITSVEPL